MRDFIRQPGFRCVSFSHADPAQALTEEVIGKLVDGALGPLQVKQIPGVGQMGVTGNLAPMSNALTAYALMTGPRGKLGDMTKIQLSEVLEDRLAGCFPRGYTYDITPDRYELLLLPGGGVPEDVQTWCRKFMRNQRNPRYRELVEQVTYPFDKMLKFYEKIVNHFHITLS